MTLPTNDVKPRRPYDARNRTARAKQTHERILIAAERRFLSDGYPATTIASVASDANVSADTIYKTFGSKAGLVRAIRTRALAGSGDTPAELRSDALRGLGLSGAEIVAAWGALVVEVAPRVAPIAMLIATAAATDPEAKALLREIDDDRLLRMSANARQLADAGFLREGVSVDQATDVLWACSAPELYDLLVLRRGWTPEQFGLFVAATMTSALF